MQRKNKFCAFNRVTICDLYLDKNKIRKAQIEACKNLRYITDKIDILTIDIEIKELE
ncbi:MAG: hypothetical protein ACPKPY_00170 [Nitrososphaeraceae archaeon]